MRSAIIDVLSPLRFSTKEEYQAVLQTLCKYPTLAPDFYGECEPIRILFDRDNPDHVADTIWEWKSGPSPFVWKRQKPKSWGLLHADSAPRLKHSSLHLDAGDGSSQSDLIELTKRLSISLDADFSLLGIEPPRAAWGGSGFGVSTFILEKGLPDIYWATVFGKPYVELFGRDRMIHVPAFVNVELAPNLFYIQLTERLNDIVERPDVVEKARQTVKKHLGLDAFIIAPEAGRAARVPAFSFVAPQAAT